MPEANSTAEIAAVVKEYSARRYANGA